MNNEKRFKEADALFNVYKYDKAIPLLQALADEGYMPAQFLMGFCYENGTGVPQDDAKAAEWYGKAAEQGDAEAQYKLSYCYEYGCGVEKDYSKAAELYGKAAEQGYVKAQKALIDLKAE